MTRPRRSYGRPGTAVIPADWATGLRPVAEGTMTASAAIRHPGTTQAWSDEAEQNVDTPNAAYYTGTARVQVLSTQARPIITVGDREVVAQYLVTVPATVDPTELDLVTVTDSGDPALDDQTLLVGQVARGSLLVERDLFCALDT